MANGLKPKKGTGRSLREHCAAEARAAQAAVRREFAEGEKVGPIIEALYGYAEPRGRMAWTRRHWARR